MVQISSVGVLPLSIWTRYFRPGHHSGHVLELTPDGLLIYGGGYAEYVVAAGHEAPGLGG